MSLLLLLRFEVAELKSQVAELTLEVPEHSSGELRLTFTTAPRCISASELAGKKILTATPMFPGSSLSMVLSVTLPDGTGS